MNFIYTKDNNIVLGTITYFVLEEKKGPGKLSSSYIWSHRWSQDPLISEAN